MRRIEPCSGDERQASWTGHVREVRGGVVVEFDKLNMRTALVRAGDEFAPPGFHGWRVPISYVRHLADGRTAIGYVIESYGRSRRHEVVRKTNGFTTVYVRTPEMSA